MIIVREFVFDSAHKLEWHKGKCKNLHGHTYKLQIAVEGELNKNGVVMDFKDLDKTVKERVIKRLDHQYLNDIINNPTAENTCLWIWKELEKEVNLKEIKLWETPKSFAIYKGE